MHVNMIMLDLSFTSNLSGRLFTSGPYLGSGHAAQMVQIPDYYRMKALNQ